MAYEIEHEEFRERRLTLQRNWPLGGMYLAVDGDEVVAERDAVERVENDEGEPVLVSLVGGSLDPVPKVRIRGEVHEVVDPLSWYEWGAAGFPLALATVGGALGGGLGAAAMVLNTRVLRSDISPAMRYVACGAIGVAAGLTWLLLGVIIHVAFG